MRSMRCCRSEAVLLRSAGGSQERWALWRDRSAAKRALQPGLGALAGGAR